VPGELRLTKVVLGGMREVKAPSGPRFEIRIFLAGSIEMGHAENWQERIASAMSEVSNVVILNPRRDDWDSSWEQRADNPQFFEQVNWELDMLDAADIVVMYLAPDTKSPISLLELGLCARSGTLKVCCPEGFWRRGNVEVVCGRNQIPLFETLDDLIADLRGLSPHLGIG
jgi:Nucleoside 2-deoxyribosyltransferase like